VGIEIDAWIDEHNYLLIPESEDCIAESEEDLDDEDISRFSIAELESFINENGWKNNLTGLYLYAAYKTGCFPHYIQLTIRDGLEAIEVC
jgi:hypothetical protein